MKKKKLSINKTVLERDCSFFLDGFVVFMNFNMLWMLSGSLLRHSPRLFGELTFSSFSICGHSHDTYFTVTLAPQIMYGLGLLQFKRCLWMC